MRFSLEKFESFIPRDILRRGLEYFTNNQVDNGHCQENLWSADVYGTDTYRVDVEIEGGAVKKWFCDCPYDHGPICKHIAAVLYAIRDSDDLFEEEGETEQEGNEDNKKKDRGKAFSHTPGRRGRKPKNSVTPENKPARTPKNTPDPVAEIINQLEEAELRKLLQYFAQREAQVSRHLLGKYSHLVKSASKTHFRRLVASVIKSAKSGGWIDYRNAGRLGKQLDELLREMKGGETMATVYLCEEVILQLIAAIPVADDSDGGMGMAIKTAFEILYDLALPNKGTASEVAAYLFEMAFKAGTEEKYDDFDCGAGFRRLATLSVRTEKQVVQLLYMLSNFIDKKEEEKLGRFYAEGAACLKWELLSKWSGETQASVYFEQQLRYPSFRRIALKRALEEGGYDKARGLAEEGVALDTQNGFPVLVNEWKKWLLEINRVSGNRTRLVDSLEKMFLQQQNMAYFRELKTLLPEPEFSVKVEQFIRHFKEKEISLWNSYGPIFNQPVADILEEEKCLPQLMDMIESAPSLEILNRYFKLLARDNRVRYVQLYAQCVRVAMDRAAERKSYQECCRYLNVISKLGGQEVAELLAADWRKTYPRRKALLEELEGFKW